MDWQTIFTSVITSLVSSSVVTAGIIYILKKGIDRTIDYRFEKSLEESRLQFQENTRRQAAIYNKQLDILKEVLSLTYRLRNATRDITEQLEKENKKEIQVLAKKLRNYHGALIEILMEERALLPPVFFNLAHDFNNLIRPLLNILEFQEPKALEKKPATDNYIRGVRLYLETNYPKIDGIYQLMVNTVQAQIGIVEAKK